MSGRKNRIFLSSPGPPPPSPTDTYTLLAYVLTRAHAYIYDRKVLQEKIYGHCCYYYCYTGEYIFILYIRVYVTCQTPVSDV